MLKNKLYHALVYTFVVTVLLFIPANFLPEKNSELDKINADKVLHFLIFSGFSILWLRFLNKNKSSKLLISITAYKLIGFGIVFGIMSELIQKFFIYGRDGNVFDLIADILGLICGLLIYNWLAKKNKMKLL